MLIDFSNRTRTGISKLIRRCALPYITIQLAGFMQEYNLRRVTHSNAPHMRGPTVFRNQQDALRDFYLQEEQGIS